MKDQCLCGAVTIEGPANAVASSSWAERGFCSECDTPLWYRLTSEDIPDEGVYGSVTKSIAVERSVCRVTL